MFDLEYTEIAMKARWAMIGAATLAIGSAGVAWKTAVPAYTATRAIDGDTFETKENLRIRLANIDAPEITDCLGEESKQKLEKLLLNKKVYVKIVFKDNYGRLFGQAYTYEGDVALKMVEEGLAISKPDFKLDQETKKLNEAKELARSKNIGVYSNICTQAENMEKPQCNIKGNKQLNTGKKLYFVKGCSAYNTTIVQLHLGDKWFCSEKEAKEAGFAKAGGCP